jgi:hypothetical protein
MHHDLKTTIYCGNSLAGGLNQLFREKASIYENLSLFVLSNLIRQTQSGQKM